MTTQQYTPGPWSYHLLDNGKASIAHNGPLAYVGDNGNGEDNMIANARLIAAAPELFHALELIEQYLTMPWVISLLTTLDGHPTDLQECRKIARAALAHAKGE